MNVPLDISEEELDGDFASVPGLRVTCSRCGYEVEVFGIEEPSARRAAVMLREQCPLDENNFYDIGGWS